MSVRQNLGWTPRLAQKGRTRRNAILDLGERARGDDDLDPGPTFAGKLGEVNAVQFSRRVNVGKDKDDGRCLGLEKGDRLFNDDEFLHLETRLFQQKHRVHAGERLVLDDANCPMPDTSHVSVSTERPK